MHILYEHVCVRAHQMVKCESIVFQKDEPSWFEEGGCSFEGGKVGIVKCTYEGIVLSGRHLNMMQNDLQCRSKSTNLFIQCLFIAIKKMILRIQKSLYRFRL